LYSVLVSICSSAGLAGLPSSTGVAGSGCTATSGLGTLTSCYLSSITL